MTDRFKFRVWNKKSNAYIKEKMFYIDKFGGLFKYEKSKSTVYINSNSPYIMCLCGDNYILEQCTGLKDKNGKLIYEGDLIKSPNNNNLLEVIWEKGVWQTKEYREKGMHELFLYILATEYGVEIVGNIHEKESK